MTKQDLILAGADLSTTMDLASKVTTQPQDKLTQLETRKQTKLDRLGTKAPYANLDDSYTELPSGTIEFNSNKIWNEYTPGELQYMYGVGMNKYQVEQTEDGAYKDFGTGATVDPREVRRLYNFETGRPDDAETVVGEKWGLSTGRASTSDVRYDAGVDPRFNDEYRTTDKHSVNLDKKYMDMPLRYDAATVLEALGHGNKAAMANREYPDVLSERARSRQSGVGEIYKPGGMLGDSSAETITPERAAQLEADLDRMVGEAPKSWQAGKADDKYAKQLATLKALREGGGQVAEQQTEAPQGDARTRFLEVLKQRESSNNYQATKGSHSGAYQFSVARLIDLGMMKPEATKATVNDPSMWTGRYGITSREDFLQNPEVQEQLALEHVVDLERRYAGTATSEQDLYGKVAAAHLLGVDGAKDLNKVDGLGTSGNEYYELGASAVGGAAPVQDKYAQQLATLKAMREESEKEESSLSPSRLLNAAAAVGFRAGDGIISTLDLLAEGGEYLWAKAKGEDKAWSEVEGLYGKEESDALKKALGYDDTKMQELSEEVKAGLQEAWENKDGWQALKLLGKAVTTPELGGESLGFLVSLLMPGAAGKVAVQSASGVAKTAKALQAADKTLSKADAIKKAEDAAGLGYKITKTLIGQGGQINYAEQRTREAEEEYKELYGEEMTEARRAGAFMLGLVSANMDATMGRMILLGKDPAAKAIRNAMMQATPGVRQGVVSRLAKATGIASGRILGAMGEEFVTESIQSTLETTAGQYRDGNVKEVLANNAWDIATEGFLGAAGGAQFAAPTTAGQAVKGTLGVMKDKPADVTGDAAKSDVGIETGVVEDIDDDTVDSAIEAIEQANAELATGEVTADSFTKLALAELRIADSNEDAKVKEIASEKLAAAKLKIAEALERDGQELPTFGSDAEAVEFIESVLEVKEGKISTSLDNVLARIAEANGVTAESFKQLKDMYSVQQDVEIGKRGYRTYDTALKGLLKAADPDVKQIAKIVKKAQNFQTTQERYAKVLGNNIKEIELEIAAHKRTPTIAAPKSRTISIVHGKGRTPQKHTIHVKETAGGYIIDPASYKILELKKENIEGIKKVLRDNSVKVSKSGVNTDALGIAGKVVVPADARTEEIRKKRADDAKYYEAQGVTKVITDGTGKWSEENYGQYNIEVMNTGKYDKDDVVVIGLGKNTEFVTKQRENGTSYKILKPNVKNEITAAAKAGATIILDRGVPKYTELLKVIQSLMRTQKAHVTLKKIDDKFVWLPTDKAKAVEERRKKEKQEKSTKENILKRAEEEYLTTGKLTPGTYKELVGYFPARKDKTSDELIANRMENVKTKKENELIAKGLQDARIIAKGGVITTEVEDALKKYPTLAARVKAELAAHAKQNAETKRVLEELIKVRAKKLKTTDEKELEALMVEEDVLLGSIEDKVEIERAIDNSSSKGASTRFRYAKIDADGNVLSVEGNSESLANAKKGPQRKKDSVIRVNVADVSKIVEVARPTVLNSIQVEQMPEEISEVYLAEFEEALNARIPLRLEGKDAEYEFTNSPSRGLLITEIDGKREFNRSVMLAMKLVIDEYMAYNGHMLSPNGKSRADIARMLGMEEREVSEKLRRLISKKGMTKGLMANAIGKAIMSQLGLKALKNTDPEQFAKLAADIGNTAILVMEKQGRLKIDDSLTVKEFVAAVGGRYSDKTRREDATMSFVTLTSDDNVDYNEGFEGFAEMLAFDAEFKTRPSYRKIKKSRHLGKMSGDIAGFKRSTLAEKALAEFVDIDWNVNMKAIDYVIENEELVREYMGELDLEGEEYAALSFKAKEDAVVRNREIESSVSSLKEMAEELKATGNTQVWFDWKYTKNGRYMLDSNTVNPQTDKQLHRFLVTPTSNTETYTYKDGKFYVDGTDYTAEINYALAQAFGHAVGKDSTESINEFADGIKKIGASKLMDMVKNKETEVELENGEVFKIKVEHIGHVLQAILALEAIEGTRDGGKVELVLSAEFDAVTSGFGLKLMQLPIIKDIFEWLEKVGVFKKSAFTGVKSMNDQLARADFYDSYQTLAVGAANIRESDVRDAWDGDENKKGVGVGNLAYDPSMWETLYEVLPQYKEGEAISKNLRDLFKDPFMTFNYSAGMVSIRASLASVVTGKIVDSIVKGEASHTNLAEKLVSITAGVKDVKDLVEKLQNDPLSSIKVVVNGKPSNYNLEQYLESYVNAGYGSRVEAIFNDTFPEFIEAQKDVNGAFQAMFAAFNAAYLRRVREVREASSDGVISDEKKLEIIDELRVLFPAIKGPLTAEEGLDKGIGIYKVATGAPRLDDMSTSVAATAINGTPKSNKVRHAIKAFEAAVSSGSVIPTHFIDAAILGSIADSFTPIHDAIMPGLTKAKSTIKNYNQKMFEISSTYSTIQEITNRVSEVRKALDGEGLSGLLDEATGVTTQDANGKWTEKTVRELLDRSVASMQERNKEVQARRKLVQEEFKKEGVLVGHMAGIPGSMYEVDGVPSVFTEAAEMSATGVDEISRVFKTLREEFKEYDGIIEEIDVIENKVKNAEATNKAELLKKLLKEMCE